MKAELNFETKGGLTPRELQVLERLVQGDPAKEIADRLGISVHTVNRHLHDAYVKLRARNRLDAARWFREQYGDILPGGELRATAPASA